MTARVEEQLTETSQSSADNVNMLCADGASEVTTPEVPLPDNSQPMPLWPALSLLYMIPLSHLLLFFAFRGSRTLIAQGDVPSP